VSPMAPYDADERIHPATESFLSREPTYGERQRYRQMLVALPPPPRLVFWPESAVIERWHTDCAVPATVRRTGPTPAPSGQGAGHAVPATVRRTGPTPAPSGQGAGHAVRVRVPG
jgi:hypothetical protein